MQAHGPLMIEHRLIERMLNLVNKVAYLSEEEEEQSTLMEFWEFDRKMIHEKYETLVQELRVA